MPVYAAHLREIIKKGIQHPDNYERPLEGFKIILDAGNGSGGFLASDVLAPLGADTTGVCTLHALRAALLCGLIRQQLVSKACRTPACSACSCAVRPQ